MLTLSDLKEKQILFIQTEHGIKNHLFFRNENLVFEKGGEIINQASCHKIMAVFVVGDFTFTSKLISECKRRAVSLFFLNQNFKMYGSINSRADGNYLLRIAQYSLNKENEIMIARRIVENKINNQLLLLSDAKKEYDEKYVNELIKSINNADRNNLLGIEGNFGKIFFKKYFEEINWWRREPRTKIDVPNVLLDIGYTFLFNFIDALLLLFGFDTYKGNYHQLFFQRKSLSCDAIEPFRCIVDKQIIKSYHLKQINNKDFFTEKGKYILSYEHNQKYARIFMETIMDYKEPIYIYIQKYYRFIMGKGNMPKFNILTKKVE